MAARVVGMDWESLLLAVLVLFASPVCGLSRHRRQFDWGAVTTPKPFVPQLPNHMTCVLDNYESADCNWCPNKAPEEMTIWKFEYYHLLYKNWTQCRDYRNVGNMGPCACHLCGTAEQNNEKCPDDVIDFLPNRSYQIRVKTIGGLSNPTELPFANFTVHFSPKLAKPKPVRSLATSAVSKDQIAVSWNHPIRLEPDVFSLVYYVKSSSLTSGHTIQVVNTTQLNTTVENLKPFTAYNISVECAPPGGMYKSDPVFDRSVTLEDAPSQPLMFGPGGFRATDVTCQQSQRRHVRLFWKNMDESNRNGIITSYSITYNTSSIQRHLVVPVPELGALLYSHLLECLDRDLAYHVTVTMATSIGSSPPAAMFIESKAKMPTFPSNLEMEYYADGSGITAYWSHPNYDVSGFTLHYCNGTQSKSCQGDMSYTYFGSVHRDKSDYEASVNITNAEDLIYAMSTEAGVRSSGMTPWQCVYQYDGIAGTPVFSFSSIQAERSLRVGWGRLMCSAENRGRVLHYVIIWCQHDDCANTTTEVSVNRTETQYIISDLDPYTNYTVWMVAESRQGRGAMSQGQTHPTRMSRPEDPPFNVTASNVTGSEVSLMWEAGLVPNGLINSHKVYAQDLDRNSTEAEYDKVGFDTAAVIRDLIGYTRYSFQVMSCNEAGCSNRSHTQEARTKIRAPSQVTAVEVTTEGRGSVKVTWHRPRFPNAPKISYVIMGSEKEKILVSEEVKSDEAIVSHVLKIDCHARTDISLRIVVTAVSVDERGSALPGTPSDTKTISVCPVEAVPVVSYVLPLVVGFVVILVVSLCYCRRHHFCKSEPVKILIPDRPRDTYKQTSHEGTYEYDLPSPTNSVDQLIPNSAPSTGNSISEDTLSLDLTTASPVLSLGLSNGHIGSAHHTGLYPIIQNGDVTGRNHFGNPQVNNQVVPSGGGRLHSQTSGESADLGYACMAVNGDVSPDGYLFMNDDSVAPPMDSGEIDDYCRVAGGAALAGAIAPVAPSGAGNSSSSGIDSYTAFGFAEHSGSNHSAGMEMNDLRPLVEDVRTMMQSNVQPPMRSMIVGRVERAGPQHPTIAGNVNLRPRVTETKFPDQNPSHACHEKKEKSAPNEVNSSETGRQVAPLTTHKSGGCVASSASSNRSSGGRNTHTSVSDQSHPSNQTLGKSKPTNYTALHKLHQFRLDSTEDSMSASESLSSLASLSVNSSLQSLDDDTCVLSNNSDAVPPPSSQSTSLPDALSQSENSLRSPEATPSERTDVNQPPQDTLKCNGLCDGDQQLIINGASISPVNDSGLSAKPQEVMESNVSTQSMSKSAQIEDKELAKHQLSDKDQTVPSSHLSCDRGAFAGDKLAVRNFQTMVPQNGMSFSRNMNNNNENVAEENGQENKKKVTHTNGYVPHKYFN